MRYQNALALALLLLPIAAAPALVQDLVPDADDAAAPVPARRRLDETHVSRGCSGGTLCSREYRDCTAHTDCDIGDYCNNGHDRQHNGGEPCAWAPSASMFCLRSGASRDPETIWCV